MNTAKVDSPLGVNAFDASLPAEASHYCPNGCLKSTILCQYMALLSIQVSDQLLNIILFHDEFIKLLQSTQGPALYIFDGGSFSTHTATITATQLEIEVKKLHSQLVCIKVKVGRNGGDLVAEDVEFPFESSATTDELITESEVLQDDLQDPFLVNPHKKLRIY